MSSDGAEKQEHNSDAYYIVTGFRIPGHEGRTVLPPINIRKDKGGGWIHVDSGQATALSAAAGKAIEASKGG